MRTMGCFLTSIWLHCTEGILRQRGGFRWYENNLFCALSCINLDAF